MLLLLLLSAVTPPRYMCAGLHVSSIGGSASLLLVVLL
jgi:hypothetical protein